MPNILQIDLTSLESIEFAHSALTGMLKHMRTTDALVEKANANANAETEPPSPGLEQAEMETAPPPGPKAETGRNGKDQPARAKAPAKAPTLDVVRKAAIETASRLDPNDENVGHAKVQEVMARMGVSILKEMKPEQYGDFMDALRNLLADDDDAIPF